MKKILTVISIMLVALLLVSQTSYAAEWHGDIANDFDSWSYEYQDGAYRLTSNRVLFEYDSASVYVKTHADDGTDFWENFILPSTGSATSYINLYETEAATVLSSQIAVTDVSADYIKPVNNLSAAKGKYISFSLILNQSYVFDYSYLVGLMNVTDYMRPVDSFDVYLDDYVPVDPTYETNLGNQFTYFEVYNRTALIETNKIPFNHDSATFRMSRDVYLPTLLHVYEDAIVDYDYYEDHTSTLNVFENISDEEPILRIPLVIDENNWLIVADEALSYFDAMHGKYISLSLAVGNDTLSYNDKLDLLNNIYNNGTVPEFQIDFIAVDTSSPFMDLTPVTVADLPYTLGNLSNTGQMGDVTFEVINQHVSMAIQYDGQSYLLEKTLEDPSFLDDITFAFYYVDQRTNAKMIYLDYSDAVMPFLLDENVERQWAPFTLWNLETNEITKVDDIAFRTHVQAQDLGTLWAYFFADGLVYDDILGIQLSFNYYLEKDNGTQSDVYREYVSLEKDATATVNTTPEEVTTALYYSAAAVALSPVVSLIPVVGGTVGSTLFWAGITGIVTAASIDYFVFKDAIVPEIEEFVPTTEERVSLLEAYSKSDPDFDTLDQNARIHRLYLGQFDEPGDGWTEVHPVAETLYIMRLFYQWNGHVYEISGSDIPQYATDDSDAIIVPYDPIVPDNSDSEGETWDWILEQLAVAYASAPWVFWIIGGILLLLILPNVISLIKGVQKGAKSLFTPLGIAIVLIIGLIIWILTG